MSEPENPYAPTDKLPPAIPAVVTAHDLLTTTEPPIEIAGQLTWEEFWQAIAMARRPGRRKNAMVALALVLLLGWAAILGSALGQATGLWVLAVAIGLMIVLGLLRRWTERRQVRAQWRQQAGSFEYFERTLTPDYLETRTALTLNRMKWPALAGYQVSDRLILLYVPGPQRMFYILPRSLFREDAEWQRCLELLARRLPPTGSMQV